MDDKIRMISPCGVDCADCAAHRANDAPEIMEKLLSLGFKKETLPCPGCRSLKGKCLVIGGDCATYSCAAKRAIAFCYECDEFPCEKLNPAADKAGFAIQNMKVFNLCYIQKHGIDAWKKTAAGIKQRYFKGKLVYGEGPQV